MKRSTRRWSQDRLRRYQMVKNEATLYEDYYRQHPFWQMISGILEAEDKANATNDNQSTLAVDGEK